MSGDSGGRLHAFRSLAGNRTLVRVLTGYAVFVLTEYSAWIAVLVFAYSHGGATVAGVVAVAQLVPGAILAPVMAAVADRRSPVVLLAGGYLVQAAGMAAAAAAIFTGVPVAVYVSAVIACVAQATVRPAQSALVPFVAATADQLTAVNVGKRVRRVRRPWGGRHTAGRRCACDACAISGRFSGSADRRGRGPAADGTPTAATGHAGVADG